MRASDAQVRDVYFRRSRALDQVRAGIYQSAIVMRDFLLASDPDVAARSGGKVDRHSRERTDHALADCAAALDQAEAAPFRNLQAEVQVYWKLLDFMTRDERSSDTRHQRRGVFLG